MLTLDGTLATAQDSATRHPLVEITSSATVSDIPFDGSFFTGSSNNEFQPFIINHSYGISILVYCTSTGLVYAYTNADGTLFTTVPLTISPNENNTFGVSCCELANGNIGITYINVPSNYELKYRVITPAGVLVTSGVIASWATTVLTSHTWVVYDPTNARYTMFYAKQNSTNYYIYKRTSTDFITWSAESSITMTGLLTTRKIGSPSIMQMANGDWWLFFDYVSAITENVEIRNIYYSISTNKGTTWGTPVAFTSNTDISQTYKHPIGIHKTATDLIVAYTKEQAILKWANTNTRTPQYVYSMDYNPVTNKLYFWNVSSTYGHDIVELDCATWTETGRWNSTSTPALVLVPAISGGSLDSNKGSVSGSGRWHIVANVDRIIVLDSDNNTIKNYHFIKNDANGITSSNIVYAGNTTYNDANGLPYVGIRGVRVDSVTNRMWICLMKDISGTHVYTHIGYIDLTEVGTPNYTFNIVIKEADSFNLWESIYVRGFEVNAEEGFIFVQTKTQAATSPANNPGRLRVYAITGGIYREYIVGVTQNYPWYYYADGELYNSFLYDGGYIYTGFAYHSTDGQAELRGLCRINLASNVIDFFRPTYLEVDDYKLWKIVKGEGNTLLISTGYGLATFNTIDYTWQLRDQTSIPQLYRNEFNALAYDSLHEMIYANNGDGISEIGIVGIPLADSIKASNYYTGIPNGANWDFTSQGKIVQGWNDYDIMLTMSPPNPLVMIAFWENKNNTELRLKWDTEIPPFNFAPYLLTDTEIAIERDITNSPNSISFACSHGHLFDPHNKKSLFASLLKKGRKITARWGERIDGLDYWQNAGSFNVTEINVSYEKGVYTDIKVKAEDKRVIWGEKHVYATDYYQSYPEDVLRDILIDNTELVTGDIIIPNMVNRVVLEHQWVDTNLADIIDQICSRFGYFSRMDVDGNFTVGRISNDSTVNHVYPDTTKIINFTPDDKYSDFTNRVTVQGQSRDFIEVTYPEERIDARNGTVGWWGYNNDFTIPYANDYSRRCVNPRLVVIESVSSFGFNLQYLSVTSTFNGFDVGTMSEKLTYVDPNQKYCVVKVESPDLTEVLIETLIGTIGTLWIPDEVTAAGVGITIRIGTALTGLGLLGVTTILASVGNFQFEIWAQPVGKVRRSVQATANDLIHQADIGHIVEKKLEDALCYSQSDCQVVADFELLIVSLQRNRIKFIKIAHLQDEEGDTIQIHHPFTNDVMTILIVNLKRRYKKAPNSNSDGYFLDEIEGWVL